MLLYYVFFFFSCEACGILDPQPEIVPDPPALEGEVSTTGPPGKFPYTILKGLPWEEFHLYLKTVLIEDTQELHERIRALQGPG